MARPAVVLVNIGRRQGDTTRARESLKRAFVQVDCRADSVRDAVRVRRAVRSAVEGLRGQRGSTIFQSVFVDNAALFHDETDRNPAIADVVTRLDLDCWYSGSA